MGCGSSKIDDAETVALCRTRLAFVDAAVNGRYALAEAHFLYMSSIKSVGASLHRFFESAAGGDVAVSLPGDRKIESDEEEEIPGHHIKSLGSEFEFGSGCFDPDSDIENGSGLRNENLMKNYPTPSVLYQHRVPLSESERIEFETVNPNQTYYPYYNTNSQFYGAPYDYGGGGYASYGPPPEQFVSDGFPSTSNYYPPPPPAPESMSSSDFMYMYEFFGSNYPPYTPRRASEGSRDSNEVREEEGIPDLEEDDDDDHQQEIAKEVHEEQKVVDEEDEVAVTEETRAAEIQEIAPAEIQENKAAEIEQIRANGIEEITPAEIEEIRADEIDRSKPPSVTLEIHPVDDEKVVVAEEESNVVGVNGGNGAGGFKDVSEVVKEIQVQFERASDSGAELNKMLEVGKLPYRRKGSVSTKMLYAIAQPPNSNSTGDANEDLGISSGNLSATLQKLYLWEKKLLEEVKVEEKNRLAHEKKVKKLQRLNQNYAETHKLNEAGIAIRGLSTKLKISIQIIDKISVKISKLRDEELWLQLSELIQGFSRMWKAMLECNQIQLQAVQEATELDKIALSKNSNETHLESILHLEQELINWTSGFSNWIETQKSYVNSLNNYLLKCLICEPEQTPDGIAPFSPGRAGAPPVFVICNQWAQSLERLSEKEVIESIRVFAAMVLQLWEREKTEIQEKMAVVAVIDKDVEKKVKNLQKEDMKIHKKIQALDKKMAIGSGESTVGDIVYQSDTKTSIQSGLEHIFEAMDRYTSETVKVYEQLLERSIELGSTMV